MKPIKGPGRFTINATPCGTILLTPRKLSVPIDAMMVFVFDLRLLGL